MRQLTWLGMVVVGMLQTAAADSIEYTRDDKLGVLAVKLDGREILGYQFGRQLALPHLWPLRSPTGKLLTVQQAEPYPHHRSLWIADNIQLADRPAVDFYHCWKNYRVGNDPKSGYRAYIRHQRFASITAEDGRLTVVAELQWFVDESTAAVDESRALRVVPLGDGEYLLDLEWRLTPHDGPVRFVSDWVHYAWPYVRMNPEFSGEQGGVITDNLGRQGQAATNGQYASWVDYSNTIDGTTEGLALFVYPDGTRHKWLTREYGTFGPRRPDVRSGTRFTLRPGEALPGHVGILVHRGDVAAGRIAERYQQYSKGER